MKRILPALLLSMAAAPGCKKVPYVVLLDGVWAGTANESTGAALVMTANFTWDDEKELFTGSTELDGWIYNVNSVSSDKKSAKIDLINPLLDGEGNAIRSCGLAGVKVEEETNMKGDFTVNTCGGQPGEGCEIGGSFSLEMQ